MKLIKGDLDEVYVSASNQVGNQVLGQVKDRAWHTVRNQVKNQVWGQFDDRVREHVWVQLRWN
jgi:hypothetical protein